MTNKSAWMLMAGLLAAFCTPRCIAAAQVQFKCQNLKDGKIQIKNVLILPAEATLVKSSMKGSEPLVSESEAFQLGLSSVIREALAAKGCNVLPDVFSDADLEHNADLKYALSDLQARYDKLQPLLQKKPKDVTKGRFSLGDEVANFSPGAAADGLVFVRANGFLPTADMKAFVVLTGMGYTRNSAKVNISIVDAQSGAVLYLTTAKVHGGFVEAPETMRISIENSFSKLVHTAR